MFFEDDKKFQLNFTNVKQLKYGENPQQKGFICDIEKMIDFEILGKKELSYNNYSDVSCATTIIAEFFDVNAVAITKHQNPIGVALGKTLEDAYLKAFDTDPVSSFGGVIAFSQKIDKKTAKNLTAVFFEIIVAPDFEYDALEILKEKENLILIKINTPLKDYKNFLNDEIKLTPFGALIQNTDKAELMTDTFKVVTKQKPTTEIIEDMVFAWKIVKHAKSNAVVVVKNLETLSICVGQTSRIDAVEIALNKACDGSKDAVLASDAAFNSIDSIHACIQSRIKAIIQTGGSLKDSEIIKICDKYEIAMITTALRHLKH